VLEVLGLLYNLTSPRYACPYDRSLIYMTGVHGMVRVSRGVV